VKIPKDKKTRIILAIVFSVGVFFYVYTGQDLLGIFFEKTEDHEEEHGPADATVVYIVDGDTFDIASGDRVRMIGIDTPERGSYYYAEAKKHLEDLIYQKSVHLVKDVSEKDRYGRLLRHVYIDDLWVNKKMIEDGFARMVTFPPDVMHVNVFSDAQKGARSARKGLWKDGIKNEK
jgi:micrococcal nuclease